MYASYPASGTWLSVDESPNEHLQREAPHLWPRDAHVVSIIVQLPAPALADPPAQATALRRQYLYVREQFDRISGFPEQLAAKIPNPIAQQLITGEHLIESLRGAAGPYLWLRLILEHPQWWLGTRQRDSRVGLAWILARYGTCSAPDHRGDLIGAAGSALSTLNITTRADHTHHWIARADCALKVLDPDAAAVIADALVQELWGRWIVNDLMLQIQRSPTPDSSMQLVLTGSGNYRGEPAFPEYMRWPAGVAGRDDLEASGLAARLAIELAIEQIAAVIGPERADDLTVFTGELDLVSLKIIAPILTQIPLADNAHPQNR